MYFETRDMTMMPWRGSLEAYLNTPACRTPPDMGKGLLNAYLPKVGLGHVAGHLGHLHRWIHVPSKLRQDIKPRPGGHSLTLLRLIVAMAQVPT